MTPPVASTESPPGHFVADRYDPLLPRNLRNPYPAYAWLQAHDPVHWGRADDAGQKGRWYVTRYADVMAMLRDSRLGREVETVGQAPVPKGGTRAALYAARDGTGNRVGVLADSWMILRDPPVHAHLRGLVSHVYTPRRVHGYGPRIAEIVDDLLAALDSAGRVDLLGAFALPLTVRMTAHVLGLPVEDEPDLTRWSRALATLIDLNQDAASAARSREAAAQAVGYLQDLVSARRRNPGEDLVSHLATALVDGRTLSDEEIIGSLTHLLFVGNDPVMHMLGNAVLTLDRHAAARAWFCKNLDQAEAVVDECMRFDSPVQMTFRFALTDVAWHGRMLRTGDHVALVLGAANRDGAHFAHPAQLDFARTAAKRTAKRGAAPVPAHFGMGIHYCLGAPLARLEGEIALPRLYARFPKLQVTDSEPDWQPTVAVRGVRALPVVLDG